MEKVNISKHLKVFGTALYFFLSYISATIPGGSVLLIGALMMIVAGAFLEREADVPADCFLIIGYMAIFILFCMASRSWSQEPARSGPKINGMLFAFFGETVILFFCRDLKPENFLKIIMYGGYALLVYTILRYGWSNFRKLISGSERISNEVINANTLGMSAAYSIIINLFMIFRRKRVQIADGVIGLALIVILVSGSRKALLIVGGGTGGLLILNSINKENFAQSIIRILASLFVVAALLFLLSCVPAAAGIMKRFDDLFTLLEGGGDRGTDGWIRFAYMDLGMQLFKKHPLLGVGIGNANVYTLMQFGHDHYLHNNYAEMLATGGIVGTAIYYSIYLLIMYSFFRNWRKRHQDETFNVCFIIFLIWVIMDIGRVSYYDKATYFYLLLYWYELRNVAQMDDEHVITSHRPSNRPNSRFFRNKSADRKYCRYER